MVKKAGLKSSMSDEKIVKKTYLYVTKNFQYEKDIMRKKKPKFTRYHQDPSEQAQAEMERTVEELRKKGTIRVDNSHCFFMQTMNIPLFGTASLVVVFTSLATFIFCLLDSKPQANKYGESPKYVVVSDEEETRPEEAVNTFNS